jgi:alkylhydroperoxidase/carboxymuconolactone decarboxylase family protein YurZ
MKPPWMDPHLRELLALAMLAAFGCGLTAIAPPDVPDATAYTLDGSESV